MNQISRDTYPYPFPPEFYFAKVIKEGSRSRIKVLPHQFVAKGDKLIELNTEYNVSCNKPKRSSLEDGEVVAIRGISADNGFYKSVDKDFLESVTKISKSSIPASDIETVLREYDQYLDVKERSLKGKLTEESAKIPVKPTFLSRLQAKSSYACPTIENDGYYIEEEKWWYMVRNFRKNIPTLLLGPTGTAKTTAVYKLQEKFSFNLRVHDMGSMQDPISGLLGVHRLEKGESVFDEAAFVSHVQEEGIILLDELSRAPSSANNILFPCLDFRKNLPVELAASSQNREVKVHEKACFFATANIGAEYVGTSELDAALKSRFEIIEFDYLPVEVETKLLNKVADTPNSSSFFIASLADTIRNAYMTQDLSSTLSTRETISAARLVHDGFALKQACELVFLPLFEGSLSQESERSTVAAMIKSAKR